LELGRWLDRRLALELWRRLRRRLTLRLLLDVPSSRATLSATSGTRRALSTWWTGIAAIRRSGAAPALWTGGGIPHSGATTWRIALCTPRPWAALATAALIGGAVPLCFVALVLGIIWSRLFGAGASLGKFDASISCGLSHGCRCKRQARGRQGEARCQCSPGRSVEISHVHAVLVGIIALAATELDNCGCLMAHAVKWAHVQAVPSCVIVAGKSLDLSSVGCKRRVVGQMS